MKQQRATAHHITIDHEHDRRFLLHGGHRASCSCGWWSDCYASPSDAQRAVDVHLQRAQTDVAG
jgi:hypothetical protein